MPERYDNELYDSQEPSPEAIDRFEAALIDAVASTEDSKDPYLSVLFDSEGYLEVTVREPFITDNGESFVTYTHYAISPSREVSRSSNTVTKQEDEFIEIQLHNKPEVSDYELKIASIMAQYGCGEVEAGEKMFEELVRKIPDHKKIVKQIFEQLDALAFEEEAGLHKVTASELAEITARVRASFPN